MSIDLDYLVERDFICGVSRSGKTSLAVFILKPKIKMGKLVFIFDHKKQFYHLLDVEPVYFLEDIPDELEAGQTVICYVPDEEYGTSGDDKKEAFEAFAEFCYTFAKATPDQEKVFVLDELQHFETAYEQSEYLSKILDDTGLEKLNSLLIGHQMNRINDVTRNQSTRVCIFTHRTRNASKALLDYDVQYDQVKPASLPLTHFLEIDLNGNEGPKRGRLVFHKNRGEVIKIEHKKTET